MIVSVKLHYRSCLGQQATWVNYGERWRDDPEKEQTG